MQLLYILLVCIDVFSFILQHKDAYQVILDGVKGGAKEKRLAAQFIPKFFSSFPEMADAAINAQLDLCEDEDVSVSIKHVRGYRSIIVLFFIPSRQPPLCLLSFPDSTAGHQGTPAVCNWREHPQSCRYSHPAPSDR